MNEGKSFEDGEDDTFSDWEEDEKIPVKSLFNTEVYYPSTAALIENEKREYGFDLRKIVCELSISDEVALIRLVNYIRYSVKLFDDTINKEFIDSMIRNINAKAFLFDDKFMTPVLQDDALLFQLCEDLNIFDDENEVPLSVLSNSKLNDITERDHKVEEMQNIIEKYRQIVNEFVTDESCPSPDYENDNYYFKGYSNITIHEEMLRDHSRTIAYQNAFIKNNDFIKNKIILDVGCGSCILSLIAAKTGATHVYAIDASDITLQAQKSIEKNGYTDKITLIQGLIEDNPIALQSIKVDIIVSEWMGYGLFFENMLESVITARDQYLNLADGGTMLPNQASLAVELMTSSGADDRVVWWSDVYGFDMSHFAEEIITESQVQYVKEENVISSRCTGLTFDLNTITAEDLDFTMPFQLNVTRDSPLHAFIISFDVTFNHLQMPNSIVLSTAPSAPSTHWKQLVLWLEPASRRLLCPNDTVNGTLRYLRRIENKREYELCMSWSIVTKRESEKTEKSYAQNFVLR